MNWLAKTAAIKINPWPVVTLAIFLCLTACEDPSKLGIETLPGDELTGLTLIDTLAIETETVQLDSVLTGTVSNIYGGVFNDPVLGKVTAIPFFTAAPVYTNDTSQVFKASSSIDSVKISFFVYNNEIYGDTNQTQTFYLHKTLDTISGNTAVTNRLTSNATGRLYPGIGERIATVTQKVSYSRYYISFNLSKTAYKDYIATQRFRQAVWGMMKNNNYHGFRNDLWQDDMFRGFALVPDAGNTSIVTWYTNQTNFSVFFSNPGDADLHRWSMSSGAELPHYTQYQADRAGTAFSGLANTYNASLPAGKSGNVTAVQSGVGLATLIKIPALANLKAKLNGAVPVQATLEFAPVAENAQAPLPLYGLSMLARRADTTTIAVNALPLVSNDLVMRNGSGTLTQFTYDYTNKKYSLAVTSYIGNVINGREVNNGFYIVPYAASNRAGVSRVIIPANTTSAPQKIKLKLYVTNP